MRSFGRLDAAGVFFFLDQFKALHVYELLCISPSCPGRLFHEVAFSDVWWRPSRSRSFSSSSVERVGCCFGAPSSNDFDG